MKKRLSKEQYDRRNELESWLYNYKSLQIAIKNLELELQNINNSIKAIDYSSSSSSKTNKFSSVIENEIAREENIKRKISFMRMKIQQIDAALEVLNEEEHEIICNFYMKGQRYFEIAANDKVMTSERTCKRIKVRALKKIEVALYGVDTKTA